MLKKKEGATFFSLDIYDQLLIKKGEEFMWAINKKFINNQWDLGKTFIFSHKPDPSKATGAFLKEINYLKELGGNNIKFVPYGNLWRLVK